MTKILSVIVGLIVTANASAAPIYCEGNGYRVAVNSQQTSAEVTDANNQPLMFGDLKCLNIFTQQLRPEGSPVVSCRTAENVADAGLTVYLFTPHNTNKVVGTLKTQTFGGPRKLADLKCVAAVHDMQ